MVHSAYGMCRCQLSAPTVGIIYRQNVICMSFIPTKYLKYRQNIERNGSFRLWKMQKNKFLSSLAYRCIGVAGGGGGGNWELLHNDFSEFCWYM